MKALVPGNLVRVIVQGFPDRPRHRNSELYFVVSVDRAGDELMMLRRELITVKLSMIETQVKLGSLSVETV